MENHLTGELPLSLSNLKSIAELGLSDNSLSGPLHPALISNWTSLTSLQLQKNSFNGQIPPEIGMLTKLTLVFLFENNLTGPIPSEIGNLKDLTELDLSGNRMSGPLPLTLWNLTNLISLQLFSNRFTGMIPPEIGMLTSLRYLSIYRNNFSSTIPLEIGKLESLEVLDLSENKFSGPIPHTLCNLQRLVTLELFQNNLNGTLPPNIGDMKSLAIFDVNTNQLRGELPNSISHLSNLTGFFVFSNNFSGTIPGDFGRFNSKLNFSKNSFSGELPREICNVLPVASTYTKKGSMPSESVERCSDFTRVRLDGKHFTNTTLSKALCVYRYLQFMAFTDNAIVGEIPKEWADCRNLTNLQVDRNKLSGEIPSELGKLTKLKLLTLGSNDLHGEIPVELGYLNKLFKLSLSENHLIGKIPPALSNLTGLEFLDLSGNRLKGNIPQWLGDCERLLSLSLNNNILSGEIPSSLGNLGSLHYMLDLSSNWLDGEIPSSLSKLIMLEVLNVSHNNLSERIPHSLSSMVSLFQGDFPYNKLTGPIPTGGTFRTMPLSAFVGNLGLCGNFTGMNMCKILSEKSNRDLILVLGLVSGIVIISTAIVVTLVLRHKLNVLDKHKKPNNMNQSSDCVIWESGGKFKFGEIVDATEDFDEKYIIGKGGFGTVYKAVLPSGLALAVKQLHTSDSDDNATERSQTSFQNEIKTLTEVRHRNIIKLHGFCSRKGRMYLVYEYANRGSLANALCGDSEGATDIDWDLRLGIIQGLAHAISYLHHDCSPPIVHRDVSLNNILLLEYLWAPSTTLHSDNTEWLLKDVLDQRLLPPTGRVSALAMSTVSLALSCTRIAAESRPTMCFVAQQLSASRTGVSLSLPLRSVTIKQLATMKLLWDFV